MHLRSGPAIFFLTTSAHTKFVARKNKYKQKEKVDSPNKCVYIYSY